MFHSCTTPPIEAAQDAYNYDAIIPKVLGDISGPTTAIQTFTSNYTIGYYRGGSTWSWSATGATVQSVSEDTRVATILFENDGTATVTVTETTMGGVTSEPKSLEVDVMTYCPLANGIADLVGSWDGTDGQGADYTYDSQITTSVDGTQLAVSGISIGFINGFWGEPVIEGGTIMMTVNVDGTVDIPRQYIYTTEYEDAPYEYEIEGSGTWDNCGDSPSMVINYDIYYANSEDALPDGAGLAEYYSSYLDDIPYLTANITLTSAKSAAIADALGFVQKVAPKKAVR